MALRRIECCSIEELNNTFLEETSAAVRNRGAVDVLVPSLAWADKLKALMAPLRICGADIRALDRWLEGQWGLWGDGRRCVSGQERRVLCRVVLAELTGLDPSGKYVDSFVSFVCDVLASGAKPADARLAAALDQYKEMLDKRGLVDMWGELDVLVRPLQGQCLLFFLPETRRCCINIFMNKAAAVADAYAFERALPCVADGRHDDAGAFASLRRALYSGKMGLPADPNLRAVELHGCHEEHKAVAQLVAEALELGVAPGSVALVFPHPQDAYPQVVYELADAGVPLAYSASFPLSQLPFGAAFLQLESLLAEDDDGVANSLAFASSPYSGLDALDARGFAIIWRGQAGSTHEQRIKDLCEGFKGRVSAKLWKTKLEKTKTLLEEPQTSERIRLMYANAVAAKNGDQSIIDDAACANALLSYLERCENLGCEPSMKDMSQLPVFLRRAQGDEDNALTICAPSELPLLSGIECVVFARMDKECYPMATTPGPFDATLSSMGLQSSTDLSAQSRFALLDALESSPKLFCCYRRVTGPDGEDCCQSALWDELMTAFRADADQGSPIQALPAALTETGLGHRWSEADMFLSSGAFECTNAEVRRGTVADDALGILFPDAIGHNEVLSPTAIEDYYRCPYRWFICRRVGANSIDRTFDQIAKGNLAHAVLERFYTDLKEKGIERVAPDNLELSLEVANQSFDWQRQHEIDRHRLYLRSKQDWHESEEIRGQVLDIVRRDAEFLPGFAPAFLELKLEDEDGGWLEYAGVPVRGKVDRIDMDGDGNVVVIDYKLSSLSDGYGMSSKGGLPTRIQTDIYARLVERCLQRRGIAAKVVGSVYRSYAKNKLRGVYKEGLDWGPAEAVSPKKDALPNSGYMKSYEEYLDEVEGKVSGLIELMKAGCIEPNPLCKDACKYCVAEGFCQERIG